MPPQRPLPVRRPNPDLGVPPPHPHRRPSRSRRSHGPPRPADRPPPHLLGLARNTAPHTHKPVAGSSLRDPGATTGSASAGARGRFRPLPHDDPPTGRWARGSERLALGDLVALAELCRGQRGRQPVVMPHVLDDAGPVDEELRCHACAPLLLAGRNVDPPSVLLDNDAAVALRRTSAAARPRSPPGSATRTGPSDRLGRYHAVRRSRLRRASTARGGLRRPD